MYKVVFIGQPGRGKTTIICNWLGLLQADIVGHSDVDAVSLLPTATGRTTVAEVHIRQCAESSSHIRVEYLPVEQQKTYIKEFCDDYYQRCAGLVPDVTDATAYTDEDRTSHDNARGKTADSPHLEIDRLIRNMVGLPLHREAQRQEIIGSVLRYGSTEDFCNEVVRRANLDNRQQRDFEIEHGDGFREELARLFRGLNNGNLETASIPKRINIDLSPQDIDLHLPEDVDEVIDTIGLDESVRDDLQERLRNPSAICVLVDRLENPPSQPIRSLLESIPTDEHEIVKRKTALFINSNWDELSRVNGADGNPELGIEIKRQEIDRVVRMGNIPYDINNTLFEDPCGAYVVSQNASMHRGLRQQVGRKAQSSIIDYYAEDAEEFRLRINDHLETIARQLRFADHRGDLLQGPSTLLMSLAATVCAFREPTNWRGPARRALERLDSLPESVGILPNLEAERDARGRLEEAEQARRDAWRELEKAVAATRDMLARVASIRETWNTRPLSLGEALDASAIPGEVKLSVLDAWRSWDNARSVESDGNAALDKMERELAALPDSPERNEFDETGIELHPVDGVPGIFDVAAALNARGDRMREFADWENDEPKLEDVPVPNTARPSIPEDVNLKRHATENVLSAASRPVAFLFRNAKYWAIVGGVLFLAFWWIPPLGRWAYGEDESFWRAAFWMFLEFFGPLLAFVWRWHREEIERMRLYSEWADKTVGDRLSELERTYSASGDLAELLAELSKKRSWAKAVAKDSIRIVKETQGFRTLPDWLSDAEERSKNIKVRFFKTWEDVLDAVAAAATLEDRKSELARRTAVWRERGEALAARRRETLELLRTAVESTRGQIAAKRETLETATKSAAATVDAALSEILSRAEIPAPSTEAARAANEAAARQADAARRAWEAAKAATDATVAKEEEEEKRRAEERLQFARLKDRMIPEISKRLETVREVSAVMPEIAERLGKLEDDLSVWEGRHAPVDGNLEQENSFAAQLMERANALAEDGRKAVHLVDIAKRAGEWADEAHVDNNAPPFATAEMATVRIVLEIVAHQTDWKKSEKAAHILQKVEERKRRLDALVCEWRQLAHRLDQIGCLEEKTEAAWKGLLWRNPSFAPHLDQMAVPVQTSGQFADALLRITEYTNALNVSLKQLNEERTRQLESFQEAATKRLGNRRAILDHFKPRPADLFERTRQGSFDDRCRLILDWYELLFSLYGERQRNAMEGDGGGSFPARAFLRLCEIAGTISVHDEIVRNLAANSQDWDALSGQIEEMMPVDKGQNDNGHRKMFEQARTAVHELTELCDACPVQSVEVRGAFQRLCEASEWICNNRLPREQARSARQKIENDFQALAALDKPIDSEERDQLLGRGDSLLQQSDFQGSKDAFESCHAGLVNRIGQLTPRLVLRITMPEKCRALTTTFSVVSPQGNPIHFDVNEARNQEWDKLEPEVVYKTHGFRCYVAGRTSVGTFSNSVDVGLIDWHGIREMDVSLWADRFSFPLSGTATPLEFRRAPNGLWYCVQATTITQFRALVFTTRSVNVFNQLHSNVCAGMTWNEAVSFATKVTNYALETGFRLPDGTTPIFRLPSPAEWKLGSQYGAKTFSSICPQFQEWCTEKNERYAFHCTIKRRNTQWLFHQDWDYKTDSFPFGTGYDSVGFRLVCESDRGRKHGSGRMIPGPARQALQTDVRKPGLTREEKQSKAAPRATTADE